MDFTLLTLPQVFTASVLSVLTVYCISLLIYNRFYPEFFTRRNIKKTFDRFLYKDFYTLMENLEIQCDDGQLLSIKQLLVSRYGIFIVETCHHRGTIYASHHQVKWLSKGLLHSNAFYNPHMDQQTTINQLAEYLNLSPKMFKTVIVFTGNSVFSPPPPSNTCKIVNLIKSISLNKNMLINPQVLPNIISNLKN